MNNMGHFCLNIAATNTAQALSSAFVAGDENATAPMSWVCISGLTSNAAIVYGGFYGSVLSATNYAFRIEIPVATVPAAPFIIEGMPMSLDKIFIYGAQNEDVAVGYIRA